MHEPATMRRLTTLIATLTLLALPTTAQAIKWPLANFAGLPMGYEQDGESGEPPPVRQTLSATLEARRVTVLRTITIPASATELTEVYVDGYRAEEGESSPAVEWAGTTDVDVRLVTNKRRAPELVTAISLHGTHRLTVILRF
jgi:NADPH-dependent ferric siderophore reductase